MRKILTILAIIIALTACGAAQTPTGSKRPPVVESVKAKHPRWRAFRHLLVVMVKKPVMAAARMVARNGL